MSAFRYPFAAKESVRNRALIVSVENFYPDVDLIQRRGAKKDTRRLHKILTKLGFSVVLKMDLEADEICEAFKTGIFAHIITHLHM